MYMSASGVMSVGPGCFDNAESLATRFDVVVATVSLTEVSFCGIEGDSQACSLHKQNQSRIGTLVHVD